MGVISSLGTESGNPVIDQTTCTRCGACCAVCPVEVLNETDRGISVNKDTAFGCIACGQCMMVCPVHCVTVTGRGIQPSDLITVPTPDHPVDGAALESLLISRRSIRAFTSSEVDRQLVQRIITSAATAPMGIPPWEVGITVFHGREKVRELAWDTVDAYEQFLKVAGGRAAATVMGLVLKKTTADRFSSFIIPLGRKLVEGRHANKDLVLYDAPVALLFHTSPYAENADAVIACTYAMLAAESEGLGTCMIGCVAPMVSRNKRLLKKYGLPPGHTPQLVLIMGYAKFHYQRTIRRTFRSVHYFE